MEFEFDKEMDSLLRQTAKSDILFPKQNADAEHIDADEISMFAENALPEKARPRVMKHLADCTKCRTILSNVIVLNAEDEKPVAVTAPSETAETVVASTEPNWFQRLFTTKNLAFGMGALALIFAVGIGFIVVQNIANNGESELAKTTSNESDSMADSATDTLSNTTNDNQTVPSASDELSDSDAKTESDNEVSQEPLGSDAPADNKLAEKTEINRQNQETSVDDDESFAKTKPKESRDNESEPKKVGRISPTRERSISPIEEEADIALKDSRKEDSKPGAVNQASSPPRPDKPITSRGSSTATKRKMSVDKNEQSDKTISSGESIDQRTVGNKTFVRKSGVWTDSVYTNQPTTSVRRNSSDYRKLDSGLRSITDKLSGTVIVVWKRKAYKIQ